ncbi:MAG: glycosyltransferase family 2 protein [Leptospiraceae bacterium]|nr:glycosyltransferase family 2 protein [Leptospiraceae bacterium]
MNSNRIEVSIILPTYNEVENIESMIHEIEDVCTNFSHEVIVVDDNSPDGTYKKVEALREKYPSLVLIRRFHERGLSSAVVRGMEDAEGKFFIVLDADGQHDPSVIPKIYESLKSFEIVVASRQKNRKGYGKFSLFRKLLSKVGNFLTTKILKINVNDPMSGYFGIRRNEFEKISEEMNPRGFKILLEILFRSRTKNITEINYEFKTRKFGKTKLNFIVVLDFMISILEIYFYPKLSADFLRYGIIGVSGIFVNLTVQFIANNIFSFNAKTAYFSLSISVILGFIFSVTSNFMLNNIWTFQQKKFKFGKDWFMALSRFALVAILGLLIQISVWMLVLGELKLYLSGVNFQLLNLSSNLIGILASTTSNYFLSKRFAWRISL